MDPQYQVIPVPSNPTQAETVLNNMYANGYEFVGWLLMPPILSGAYGSGIFKLIAA